MAKHLKPELGLVAVLGFPKSGTSTLARMLSLATQHGQERLATMHLEEESLLGWGSQLPGKIGFRAQRLLNPRPKDQVDHTVIKDLLQVWTNNQVGLNPDLETVFFSGHADSRQIGFLAPFRHKMLLHLKISEQRAREILPNEKFFDRIWSNYVESGLATIAKHCPMIDLNREDPLRKRVKDVFETMRREEPNSPLSTEFLRKAQEAIEDESHPLHAEIESIEGGTRPMTRITT